MRNRLFLLVIFALVVLGALATFWWYQGRSGSLSPKENILVLGIDDTGPGAPRRSDTIFIVHLGQAGQPLKLLSVPRDLKVRFPDGSEHKINAAYAQGGPKLSERVLSDFLSLHFSGYLVLGYQGFVKLMDLLMPDGVTLTLDRPFKYDDSKQNLHINLPAGTQQLKGQSALDYVRYRDAQGEDLGRISRQQGFIQAVTQQMKRPQSLAQLKELARLVGEQLRTDLSPADLYHLAQRLQTLAADQLKMRTLPGRTVLSQVGKQQISYFIADPLETEALVSEFFQGISVLSNSDVKLIVLNGNKTPLLARQVSEQLQAQSFTIVATWNAKPFDYAESYLIDLKGDRRKAQLVATALPPSVRLVTPGKFQQLMEAAGKGDRLKQIAQMLRTTKVPPNNRAVDLNEADLLLILGKGFSLGK